MSSPSLVVFAPSPLLTITVEEADTPGQEIHLHAGGQGFWVARMTALLGADVSLCRALGGESGAVLRGLIARENVELSSVECAASNGVYIHICRDGAREQIARTDAKRLSRHEADELYGLTLFAALGASLAGGQQLDAALRLAMAAGCLNATRHGLGTGTREQIEQLSHHIEITELSSDTNRA
jgi:1-phosphofructokinase